MQRIRLCGAVAALLLAAPISDAGAAEVTFSLRARVTFIVIPPPAQTISLSVDDEFTAAYSFETTTPLSPITGSYAGALRCVQLEIGGAELQGIPDPLISSIVILDDAAGAEEDSYAVNALVVEPDIGNFALSLFNPTTSQAIVGTALSPSPPDLTPFSVRSLSLVMLGSLFGTTFNAEVLSLEPSEPIQCPEPHAGAAGLAGLAVVLVLRRSARCSRRAA